MSEYLKREDVRRAVLHNEGDAVIAAIDKLPTVEVIRCKECRWWEKDGDSLYGFCHACKHGYHTSNWTIGIYRRQKEDFFCADGELIVNQEE